MNKIDKTVADYLASQSIKFEIRYIADMSSDKVWKHDLWQYTFSKQGAGVLKMKIIRCSMYSATPAYHNDLISHTWLIDNEDNKNLVELLRYDCFGFSDATMGRVWGRSIAYSESYRRKTLNDASLINETFEKIVKVKSDLAEGNRNVNITMGLF